MRRATLFFLLLLTFCFVLSIPNLQAGGNKTDTRPNIVLVMVDDMGYSDIGCYGGEIKTPNIDKLAKNALRFTQFHNTARCCPTRASLMSGLYPHQAGMGWMTGRKTKYEGYQAQINNKCVTIAEVLKMSGYSTYMSGKWHLTQNGNYKTPNGSWPTERGFDRFWGTLTGAGSFYTPSTLTDQTTPIEAPKKGFYYTDAITDHAIEFLNDHEKKKKNPFFLYVAYTAPHWPLHALEEDIAKYKDTYTKGWDALRKERHARMKKMNIVDPKWKMSKRDSGAIPWKKVPDARKKEMALKMAIYAAQVDRVDQNVGRLVANLEQNGELDNTLIFFLADNGGCAEGGLYGFERMMGGILGTDSSFASYGLGWANASNTPFRLFKHWVHEGGVSTPLIMHWPARIPQEQRGQLRRQPGHLIDIMTTCVEVGKAKYPQEYKGNKIRPMEGKSLTPAILNKEIKREALYWEHEGNRAVRVGDWKLVARGAKGDWQLYNLKEDGTETNDLASKQPERVEQMARMWQAYAERANVLPLVPYYGKKNSKK